MAHEDQTLGDVLLPLRGSATQHEMGARLGVDQSTYQRWERDESAPRYENFAALMRLLNVDLEELGALIIRGQDRQGRRKEVR